jgi:uncharacterized protein (TIGR02145 family)
MRKLLLTTAAVAAAIGLAVAGEPSFGTFTDTRDGQTYKTVKIGTQTWMAQNLNYQIKGGSWCYEKADSNCIKYGRLYDWLAAITACPNGWKLPSREDWIRLVAMAGGKEIAGKKLKPKSGWNNRDDGKSGNGTDNYGFSALPGSFRRSDGGFGGAGYGGYWWTAEEYSGGYAYYRSMYYHDDLVDEDYDVKGLGFSVRCVKE